MCILSLQQIFSEILLWDRSCATKTELNKTNRLIAFVEEIIVLGAGQVGLADQSHQVVCQKIQFDYTEEQEARDLFSGGEQPGKLWIGPERIA